MTNLVTSGVAAAGAVECARCAVRDEAQIGSHLDSKVGFFGTAPVAQPEVSTVSAAAILAALVTLGLVADDT